MRKQKQSARNTTLPVTQETSKNPKVIVKMLADNVELLEKVKASLEERTKN